MHFLNGHRISLNTNKFQTLNAFFFICILWIVVLKSLQDFPVISPNNTLQLRASAIMMELAF